MILNIKERSDIVSDKMLAKIGNNANGNTIIQGVDKVTVNHFGTSSDVTPRLLEALASADQYEAINIMYRNMVEEMLNNISSVHPLKPYFGVKAVQMGTMQQLVSTPLVEDALKLFPKTVKSTINIRLSDYPGFCPEENIWDYAYRTQRVLEVTTKAYKEYLGDHEDPFPVVKFQDGMKLEIHPPEFPEAMKATVKVGFISCDTLIRRVPTDKYNMIVLSNEEDENRSFNIVLQFNQEKEVVHVTMKRVQVNSLDKMLQREKLIQEIIKNKLMAILVNGQSLATLDGVMLEDLEQPFFASASANIRLIENLKMIEEKFHCHFDLCGRDFTEEDYYYAAVLASTIQQKWELLEKCKNVSTLANYDKIHLEESEEEFDREKNPYIYELNDVKFEIGGVKFKADKFVRAMYCAKMANEKKVKKEIEQKKATIKMNFIPYQKGKKIIIFGLLDHPIIVTE